MKVKIGGQLEVKHKNLLYSTYIKVDIFYLPISDNLLNKVVPIPVNNRGLTKVDLKKIQDTDGCSLFKYLYSFYLFLLNKAGGRG